jgi:hypothetical protein
MFLKFLVPILEERGLNNMRFQQDGASPHFHTKVTEFLNHKFPVKMIGRDGLSPVYFVLLTLFRLIILVGVYIKDVVYMPPLATTLPGTYWEEKTRSGHSYN